MRSSRCVLLCVCILAHIDAKQSAEAFVPAGGWLGLVDSGLDGTPPAQRCRGTTLWTRRARPAPNNLRAATKAGPSDQIESLPADHSPSCATTAAPAPSHVPHSAATKVGIDGGRRPNRRRFLLVHATGAAATTAALCSSADTAAVATVAMGADGVPCTSEWLQAASAAGEQGAACVYEDAWVSDGCAFVASALVCMYERGRG